MAISLGHWRREIPRRETDVVKLSGRVEKDSGGARFYGRISKYTAAKVRPFAYGRFSALFEAKDPSGGSVCIKLFSASPGVMNLGARKEFTRELDARRGISHAHILPILDYGEDEDGAVFLVMPLCNVRGGTLEV